MAYWRTPRTPYYPERDYIQRCRPGRREGLGARLQRRPHKQVPPNEGRIVQIIQIPNHVVRMMTREQAKVSLVAR